MTDITNLDENEQSSPEVELQVEQTQMFIDELPDIEEVADETEESGDFSPETYGDVKINRADTFLDEHGNTIDPNSITVLDRLKLAAKQIGQEVNDPDPSCKKCYGRGYVGINLDGNIPLPCNCIYKKFFKNNPDWRGQQMPSWNRAMKRNYDKKMSKYITLQAEKLRARHANEEKSRANLGKNTPGFGQSTTPSVEVVPVETETVETETVETLA